MKKRILSTAMAFVMAISVCSAFCLSAQPVSAVSKAKSVYMTSTAFESEEMGPARYEKIGKYYFWTRGVTVDGLTLEYVASASSKAKILHSAKKNETISQYIVTDGKQVYYAVNKYDDKSDIEKGTIYKTSVNGKKKKIKTVPSMVDPYAYYNGKLYYGVYNKTKDLYVYDMAKKTTKKLKKHFFGESSYGKYITYRKDNDKGYIYNITTGKSKKIPGERTVVYGKNIYYYTYSSNGVTVKKCDLSGKHSKTIKNLTGHIDTLYLGRKVAYFRNPAAKQHWKLAYKTKKLTKIQF